MMNNIRVFADTIEDSALEQLKRSMESAAFEDATVRIMPDVHGGVGSVIGFTAHVTNGRVIPNVVGVDIGCGMLVTPLDQNDINFMRLDRAIKRSVPSGPYVHSREDAPFTNAAFFSKLYCAKELQDTERLRRSVGTLGGGNHFIEIDQDEDGRYYLIIHSGSRNLGVQVAQYYQRLAVRKTGSKSPGNRNEIIEELKAQGRESEIEDALRTAQRPDPAFDDLAYLEGDDARAYLHDMRICVTFAKINRSHMASRILSEMDLTSPHGSEFHVIHNYIEVLANGTFMIRKGAISARFGEPVLIPLNMKNGCILGRGKGNPEWNMSAPHGAGRRMSRSQAFRTLSLNDFRNQMDGVYSSSVCDNTLDESPMAYKDPAEIERLITQTVYDTKLLTPVYNFKAHDELPNRLNARMRRDARGRKGGMRGRR